MARTEFLRVLAMFSCYSEFGKVFGAKDADGAEETAGKEKDADASTLEQIDDPFARVKEKTAGIAVKLLDFLFDLFSLTLDDDLSKFLTNDANTNLAVCQVGWEDWQQEDLVNIRRTLSLHRMTVPARESSEVPAASTRGLKRSLSSADSDGEADANDRQKEVTKERVEAWRQAQTLRRKWLTASSIKTDKISLEQLDKWWARQTAAQQFQMGLLVSRTASSCWRGRGGTARLAKPRGRTRPRRLLPWKLRWTGCCSDRGLATRSSSSTAAPPRSAP